MSTINEIKYGDTIYNIGTETTTCLYDRLGVYAPNLNKPDGIKGLEEVSIDMSSYKRIKVYGFMNARFYQFTIEIDLTDSLNTFEESNKYWGRATVRDISLTSSYHFFNADCSVSQDKQIFKVENFGYTSYNEISEAIPELGFRNDNTAYVVTKIYGIK